MESKTLIIVGIVAAVALLYWSHLQPSVAVAAPAAAPAPSPASSTPAPYQYAYNSGASAVKAVTNASIVKPLTNITSGNVGATAADILTGGLSSWL
jgi:hypothetical protein